MENPKTANKCVFKAFSFLSQSVRAGLNEKSLCNWNKPLSLAFTLSMVSNKPRPGSSVLDIPLSFITLNTSSQFVVSFAGCVISLTFSTAVARKRVSYIVLNSFNLLIN